MGGAQNLAASRESPRGFDGRRVFLESGSKKGVIPGRHVSVAIGAREVIEFRVTEGEMEAFRRLSADVNPLHDDAGFARRRGFDGVVVYGGLIVAQVSRLLGTRIPGHGCVWRSVSLRFRNPLYVGELAQLSGVVVHANEDLGTVDLKLSVVAGGRRIAEGEAAALLVRERADA